MKISMWTNTLLLYYTPYLDNKNNFDGSVECDIYPVLFFLAKVVCVCEIDASESKFCTYIMD